MKRVLYVVPDETEGGSWDGRRTGGKGLKDAYYPGQDLQYGQLGIDGSSRIGAKTQTLYTDLFAHIAELRGRQIPDTQFFDHLHDDLKAVFACFESIRVSDLMTAGSDLENNTRTLADLKRLCNLKP